MGGETNWDFFPPSLFHSLSLSLWVVFFFVFFFCLFACLFVCFLLLFVFFFIFFNTVLENSKQNKETASSRVVSEKGRVVQLVWDLQEGEGVGIRRRCKATKCERKCVCKGVCVKNPFQHPFPLVVIYCCCCSFCCHLFFRPFCF